MVENKRDVYTGARSTYVGNEISNNTLVIEKREKVDAGYSMKA
jgi:hypothetical protein